MKELAHRLLRRGYYPTRAKGSPHVPPPHVPASSRAWQWWCVSWGLTNFSRDWLQVAHKSTQGLVAKEAVSLSPLVERTLYRGSSPSLQDDCHISQSTLPAREVGGGEVGWIGKCGGHLFAGKGRSGKGRSCLRVGRKTLTTPHCLQISLLSRNAFIHPAEGDWALDVYQAPDLRARNRSAYTAAPDGC